MTILKAIIIAVFLALAGCRAGIITVVCDGEVKQSGVDTDQGKIVTTDADATIPLVP